MKRKENLTWNYLTLTVLLMLLWSLGFNLFSSGIMMNAWAIESNNHKMPVLASSNIEFDNRHFVYSDPSQVKNFLLTDIFHVGVGYISIGDIFIFASSIVCVFALEFYPYSMVKYFLKNRKRKGGEGHGAKC